MLNDDKEGVNCIRRLNGNIFIIGGNHCTANRIKLYDNIRPDIHYLGLAHRIKYRGYNFYLSHYPTLTSNNDNDKPLKARIISLCGHSHITDPFYDWDKGLIYHVELDAHNCCPILIDDIIEEIKTKINKGE
jgi:calcineurin-like phosphoesterase family protein